MVSDSLSLPRRWGELSDVKITCLTGLMSPRIGHNSVNTYNVHNAGTNSTSYPLWGGPFTAFWLYLTYFKNRQNFLSLELDYPVHVITVQGGFNVCKTINVMHKRVLCKAIAFLGHIIF